MGIAYDYDFVFEMDADFSHNPNDLDRLYRACVDIPRRFSYRLTLLQRVNVLN